jgi:hypothetical protein
MSETVRVQVDAAGALRNGRFAFTDRYTLVTELLQNARRAGASAVRIEHDPAGKRLVVIDDGCGVQDFQRLLTINESGWSEDTVEAERPFGVGFSKCLYAASRVSVKSRGRQLSFECDQALQRSELIVEPCADAPAAGTVVALDGVDLPRLSEYIDRLTRGFAVPVSYNGQSQRRAHALGHRDFALTQAGLLSLGGSADGRIASGVYLYLDGHPIGELRMEFLGRECDVDVLHLDSRTFAARLPDRTSLIDAEEKRLLIEAARKALWHQVLLERKSALPPDEFVERYFQVAEHYALTDVFDDIELVPRQVCWFVGAYPTATGGQEEYFEPAPAHLRKADIDAGRTRIAEIDALDDPGFATLMYARAAELLLVDSWRLGAGHWLRQGIRRLSTEHVEVAAAGAVHAEVVLDGIYVYQKVLMCEGIEIRHGDDAVRITSEAVFDGERAWLPDGCRDGDLVKQLASYTDGNDVFDETSCGLDAQALVRAVTVSRCADAASVLAFLLRSMKLQNYGLLSGATLQVAIAPTGNVTVEQVA